MARKNKITKSRLMRVMIGQAVERVQTFERNGGKPGEARLVAGTVLKDVASDVVEHCCDRYDYKCSDKTKMELADIYMATFAEVGCRMVVVA